MMSWRVDGSSLVNEICRDRRGVDLEFELCEGKLRIKEIISQRIKGSRSGLDSKCQFLGRRFIVRGPCYCEIAQVDYYSPESYLSVLCSFLSGLWQPAWQPAGEPGNHFIALKNHNLFLLLEIHILGTQHAKYPDTQIYINVK